MIPVKVFIAPEVSKEIPLRLLGFDFIEKVASAALADFILIPQFIRQMSPKVAHYLAELRAFAAAHKKEVIALKGGDLSYRFMIPGCITFAASLYKSKNYGEIAMPAPIDDLSSREVASRVKSTLPTVSFCGYAEVGSVGEALMYYAKNILYAPVYRRGIYWRRKAMGAVSKDARMTTSFIVRPRFGGKSGNLGTPQMREEYLQNIEQSDFVLCPKGDANYSARFYETLALGRIPVLIDTDMVLPLEHLIDYSKIMVRVPYSEVNRVGDYILDFWNAHSDESFQAVGHEARETFEKYLRYDAFFDIALQSLKEGATLS
jgi:hypothetical protein